MGLAAYSTVEEYLPGGFPENVRPQVGAHARLADRFEDGAPALGGAVHAGEGP